MYPKYLSATMLAAMFLLIFGSSALAQSLTYAIVSPAAANQEPSSLPPSNEKLAPTAYLARFQVTPIAALSQVARSQSQIGPVPLNNDEIDLLQEASSGRADHWSMAEAALLISGVTDASDRQHYLAQINQIIEGAKAATAGASTTKDKVTILGSFLLKGPMHAGYDAKHWDLRTMLDTGHFNCVSSTMLFMITAHALNIPVGAVLQSRHIFVRVPGFDVEPTSGKVFPSEIRNQRILEDLERNKSDVEDTFTQDRLYHEVGDFGVLTAIYYDDGCKAERQGQYFAAAVSNLKAACLDPYDPNLGKHLDRDFDHVFKAAIADHQLAQASSIANLYRQISRDPATVNAMFQQLAGAQGQVASR